MRFPANHAHGSALCLDRLATTAAGSRSAASRLPPRAERSWWAHALARQCRDALDDLTFLAPWVSAAGSPNRLSDFAGIDEIPTLRELARLEESGCRPSSIGLAQRRRPRRAAWLGDLRRLIAKASQRARATDRGCRTTCTSIQSTSPSMEYDFLFDKARSSAGDRLQRRRAPAGRELLRSAGFGSDDCAVSWRLHRDNCRRRAGLPSGACSRPPAAARSSCRGAGRCSSTSCRCW